MGLDRGGRALTPRAALLVSVLGAPAVAAPAQPADSIETRTGETLVGEIAKELPDGTVIVTRSGGAVLVPREQTKRVVRAPRPASPPRPPPADPPPSREARGIELVVRTGYTKQFGKLVDRPGGEMSGIFPSQVPLVLDLGARPSPYVFLGGSFRYAFVQLGDRFDRACSGGASCSAYGFALGGMIAVHFAPLADLDPWLGLGMAFSSEQVNAESDLGKSRLAFRGIDWLRASLGVDYKLSRTLRLGGYAELAATKYFDYVGDLDGARWGAELKDTTNHYGLTIGPRLSVIP